MNIIYFVILSPLVSCFILLFFINYLPKVIISKIGVSSVFFSMVVSFYGVFDFLNQNVKSVFYVPLWTWIVVDDFKFNLSFLLDGLSITMLVMITTIGFLINLFSSWYMRFQVGHSRFFAYMNLFIASMLLLVLADNLVIMYVGWEGVGLCSYLLVGFYYKKFRAGYAAIKGFLITRIGDIFLLLAIFIIYKQFGTLNFEELKCALKTITVSSNYCVGSLNYILVFLVIGVIAKSAQVPLQIWLVDAMVGPTPASALIHSSTMVVSGVYLIARMHFLFCLSPEILYYVGIVGSVTLIISCLSALVQTNIKRILAYSTMSQIGYMLIALAMQEWVLAINHLVTHAIFKTLLFLSSGVIIILLNNEQNIFKMGGLKKRFPILHVSFLIAGASLASFPVLTSGFYSKGNILFSALENNYFIFLISGLLGSLLTSIYTFRMIFLIFYGKEKRKFDKVFIFPNVFPVILPLVLLIVFSTVFFLVIELPVTSVFLEKNFLLTRHSKLIFEIFCSFISLLGIFVSYYFWIKNTKLINFILDTKLGNYVYNFWLNSWGIDFFYKFLFINPYLYLSKLLKYDPINIFMSSFLNIIWFFRNYLKYMCSGYLRIYIFSIVLGFSLLMLITIKLYI